MISNRFIFVGIQLLVLAYTAHSFVLLTANIEDIKKLARKFVSDSLADKFADFVVKATEQMSVHTNDTSKSDTKHDISDSNEYELRNIARQSKEKQQQTSKVTQETPSTRNEDIEKLNYMPHEQTSIERSEERVINYLNNERTWGKTSKELFDAMREKTPTIWRDSYEKSKEPERLSTKPKNSWMAMKNNDLFSGEQAKTNYISQYVNQKENEKEHEQLGKKSDAFYKDLQKDLNNLLYSPTSHKPLNFKPIKPEISESNLQDERLPEPVEAPAPGSRYKKINDRDSKRLTFDFAPLKLDDSKKRDNHDETPHPKRKNNKNNDLKAPSHDVAPNDLKPVDMLWTSETTRLRESSEEKGDSKRITTKKEKTDFDQYDNRNYPKADYVATSGHMMLPRIPNDDKKPKPEMKSWWEKELKLPNAAQLKTWLATM